MLNASVIICSINRPEELHNTVESLLRQQHLPTEILISVPDSTHVLPTTSTLDKVRIVCGPRGSSVQRNTALNAVSNDCDMVMFLDDDVELCQSFVSEMARMFETTPDLVMGNGTLLRNGNVNREEAIAICKQREAAIDRDGMSSSAFIVIPTAYGCNAAARWHLVRDLRFDERLPLYGWLEDQDYSFRANRFGQTLRAPAACAVHLAIRTGRISEVKYGYSQIVNPCYLWKKNKACSLKDLVFKHWLKQVSANLILGALPRKEIDRRGRLRGNLIAFTKLLAGHCEPEDVLQIPDRG